jgi:hypothetical protein
LQPIAVEEEVTLPIEFLLRQNYPNPFNTTTTIKFQVSPPSADAPLAQSAAERHGAKGAHFRFVSLKIFDMLGREVATLVEGELPAGEYSTSFNALDLSSGLYFSTLQAVSES